MSLQERVSCPFDPVHVVERRRLQAHIIKCKRNLPPNHDFVQCNFWHLHYIRRSELADHMATCEHRLQKEANKKTWDAQPEKSCEPKFLVHDTAHTHTDNWSDNWDEIVVAPFKPENVVYATIPQGLSKSKRKVHREKERERVREMEEKRPKGTARGEKSNNNVDNEDVPPPRKPAEDPVKRLGVRIAARFPVDLTSEQAVSSHSSSLSNKRSDKFVLGGRGRGLLGWSDAADPKIGYEYSPAEYPSL